jgi:hypothetical protein
MKMDVKGDLSSTSGGGMVFQLPVVVTTKAETVVVGQPRNDNDNERGEGEMIFTSSSSSSIVPNATIAAGDDEISTGNNICHHQHHETNGDNQTYNENRTRDDDKSSTTHHSEQLPFMMQGTWDFLISSSLLFVFKLVFGGLGGIRTLFLVHICNFVMSFLSKTDTEVGGRWIPLQLQPKTHTTDITVTRSSSSMDKGSFGSGLIARPPPTFIALVLFTIGTLIVHPEGYTWIIVYKIRCVPCDRKKRFRWCSCDIFRLELQS